MKRTFLIGLGVISFLFATGCDPEKELDREIAVSSIRMEPGAVTIAEGETMQLKVELYPEDATNQALLWDSSDTEVATVKDGTVTGVSIGSTTITVTTVDGGKTATCEVTVSYEFATPEVVDMGLSVKWGTFNVGAKGANDYGRHYAWGETKPKSKYVLENYIWFKELVSGSNPVFSMNAVTLAADVDAASVLLGEKWRMPMEKEWEELISYCVFSWQTQNGVSGLLATSKLSGNSIFLPASGTFEKTLMNQGGRGCYWTSALHKLNKQDAVTAVFSQGMPVMSHTRRYTGAAIRPVTQGDKVSTSLAADLTPTSAILHGRMSLTAAEAVNAKYGFYINLDNGDTEEILCNNLSKDKMFWSNRIHGLQPSTEYSYRAFVRIGGQTEFGNLSTFKTPDDRSFGEAIDLGLSVKWRSCNIGAPDPYHHGEFFAWGETEDKGNYETWDGYSWSSDDVAHARLGGKWRIPTAEEWQELIDNCNWTWSEDSALHGYIVTSKNNGNSIYLSSVEYWYPSEENNHGDDPYGAMFIGGYCKGVYWSSSLSESQESAMAFLFESRSDSNRGIISVDRYRGVCVRPVTD